MMAATSATATPETTTSSTCRNDTIALNTTNIVNIIATTTSATASPTSSSSASASSSPSTSTSSSTSTATSTSSSSTATSSSSSSSSNSSSENVVEPLGLAILATATGENVQAVDDRPPATEIALSPTTSTSMATTTTCLIVVGSSRAHEEQQNTPEQSEPEPEPVGEEDEQQQQQQQCATEQCTDAVSIIGDDDDDDDDVPEPIKVLDDIISEFEEAATKPAIANNCGNGNGGGENQSEDDGYMSLSRKNMSQRDAVDDAPVTQTPSTDTVPEDSFNEIAASKCTVDVVDATAAGTQHCTAITQMTLPKARLTTTGNYSSLPCCGARGAHSVAGNIARNHSTEQKTRTGSCNGERNALGIDISAVHNAVIRGGLAKLPESIVNEHPVTIYPGPPSSSTESARVKRHQYINSVEKHKQMCHILKPQNSTSSSASASASTTTTSSSGEASPATSSLNVTKLSTRKEELQLQSEDSIDESTLSTDITPVKVNGVAWEIHFKNSNKKPSNRYRPQAANSSGSKKHNKSNKATPQSQQSSESIVYNNSYGYNASDMLGKGTFVIRRSMARKPPKAMDIFNNVAAHVPTHAACPCPPSEDDDDDDVDVDEDEEDVESLPPPPPAPTCAAEVYDNSYMHEFEPIKLSTATRRSLERANVQRIAITSPRDRLTLNIEGQQQPASSSSLQRESNAAKAKYLIAQATVEELNKPLRKSLLSLNEKRLSAESMPDKSTSSEEFDEVRLNGNNYDLYGYGANGMKAQDYDLRTSAATTPRTDLAPTLEEDEELSDFSYGCTPMHHHQQQQQHHHQMDMRSSASQNSDLLALKRPLEFRPGVHKSESAKEMLLSQSSFGPLPPSPSPQPQQLSKPDIFDYDAPLPPSPIERKSNNRELASGYLKTKTTIVEVHKPPASKQDSVRRSRDNISALRHFNDELPPPPAPTAPPPPLVPPHRGYSLNTMKSWSIDSNYRRKSPKLLAGYGTSNSGITTPTALPPPPPPSMAQLSSYESGSYTRRHVNYGTKRSLKQSPREEHRLQTSCSLPETPIFARGCDIPRTPYRRQNEPPPVVSGSRTAPRSCTSNNVAVGNTIASMGVSHYGTAGMCRQRSINHALASNEMLRMTGVPARGWYPKQRSMRPASTENIDRLSNARVWDNPAGMSGTGQTRKPLTLPPNLTPSFLNKSPREALRRVTSLLITKKKSSKERKHKAYSDHAIDESHGGGYEFEPDALGQQHKDAARNAKNATANGKSQQPKKKGLFKTLWKRTKHFSLDQ